MPGRQIAALVIGGLYGAFGVLILPFELLALFTRTLKEPDDHLRILIPALTTVTATFTVIEWPFRVVLVGSVVLALVSREKGRKVGFGVAAGMVAINVLAPIVALAVMVASGKWSRLPTREVVHATSDVIAMLFVGCTVPAVLMVLLQRPKK